jgi:hypothetical protein
MKRTALVLAALLGAAGFAPAFASTDDPTSPFYLLPTQNSATTLHAIQASDTASTQRK